MCAVQHEPPRVPLTARPNPRPEPTSAWHPAMGRPTAPAAAPAFGVLPGAPDAPLAVGSIPSVAAAGPAAAGCGTLRVRDWRLWDPGNRRSLPGSRDAAEFIPSGSVRVRWGRHSPRICHPRGGSGSRRRRGEQDGY